MTDPFLTLGDEVPAPDLSCGVGALGGFSNSPFTGSKFLGGFGDTNISDQDYWTQRLRSEQLFDENLYARGLLRRLVTSIIGVGLSVEPTPEASVLGTTAEALAPQVRDIAARFRLWGNTARVCDYRELRTLAEFQAEAELSALIQGDVLIIQKFDLATGLPRFEMISGNRITTPLDREPREGHTILHGVELDPRGRQVAFFVNDEFGKWTRVPAYGTKSGRLLAWLHYYTDRRLDQVRGQPILALVMQSLRDVDRYRDAEIRAAVVNSILAMFIQKDENKPSSRPLTRARAQNLAVQKSDGSSYQLDGLIPGMVFEVLQQGEKPVSFDTSRPNINFGAFEQSIIAAVAWANEMPPEVLMLSFDSNYSASKAARAEFDTFAKKRRKAAARGTSQPFYEGWFTAKVITGDLDALGYLEALRDPRQFEIAAAWVASLWGGPTAASMEFNKDVDAWLKLYDAQLATAERVVKELTGEIHSNVVETRSQEIRIRKEAGLDQEPEVAPGTNAEGDNGNASASSGLRIVEEQGNG